MAQNIFEAYNRAKKELQESGIEDYGFEARQMIRRITGYTNHQIVERYGQELTTFQENNLTAMLKQRAIRYPLQYMFGEWSFYGRDFYVGVGALIPRADTEVLVEQALSEIKETATPKILDLCAGTGCIGITLAAERRDAAVTLVEKYREAISYLEKNVARNGVSVKVVEGDVFQSAAAEQEYDLIVSNPPYIPEQDMNTVSPEVHFEPREALVGGGEDGLDFYRAIIENYRDSLKTGGKMMFEVGIGQAEAVRDLLADAGFKDTRIRKDYGDVERVVWGTRE